MTGAPAFIGRERDRSLSHRRLARPLPMQSSPVASEYRAALRYLNVARWRSVFFARTKPRPGVDPAGALEPPGRDVGENNSANA